MPGGVGKKIPFLIIIAARNDERFTRPVRNSNNIVLSTTFVPRRGLT